MQFRFSNKNKYILAASFSIGLLLAPSGYAMDSASPESSLHGQITREALMGTLADPNLKAVIDANDSQDAPGSEGAQEKRRHFDQSNIKGALQYISREKTKALNAAAEADVEPESRADALRHFGLMLHAVQDFYTRSNYVELQLESPEHKNDPYNIPLVDWNKVPDGIVGLASGTKLSAAKQGNPQDEMNKDDVTVGGGKTIISGKITYHSVARDLAVRETQRQWNLFETLLRSRCGERAAAVLAALRQASTPTAAAGTAKEKESMQTIVGDPVDSPEDKPEIE
jgi:hypothetical protein